MKAYRKIAAFLAAAVMGCLFGCASGNGESNSPSLPNAQWGGSIEEVLEDLGTSREALGENLTVYDEATGSAAALLENQEVFGQKSEGLILFFAGTKDGKGAFYRAEVYYPDEADMKGVRTEMEKAFGKPDEAVTLYEEAGKPRVMTTGEENQYWQGPLLQDALDDSQQIALRQDLIAGRPESLSGMSDSQWESYLKNPAIWAGCYTNYQSPLEQYAAEAGPWTEYRNAVILDASLQGEVDRLS